MAHGRAERRADRVNALFACALALVARAHQNISAGRRQQHGEGTAHIRRHGISSLKTLKKHRQRSASAK
jgi:hypothetical protein